MVKFASPNFESELRKALAIWEEAGLGVEDLSDELVDPNSEDLTSEDIPDYLISEETMVQISLPQCDRSWSLTYRQLISWLLELDGAELINNCEVWTNSRCIIRVEAQSGDFLRLVRDIQRHVSDLGAAIAFSIVVEGQTFECALRSGLTLFGFLVVTQGSYEDFLPPVLDDELFIEVLYDPGTEREVVRNLVSALLFEISASIGIDLQSAPRPDIYVNDEGEEDEDGETEPPLQLSRLRPLMVGKGIPELLRHYNDAISIRDPGLQIVLFTKVIEFVAQTVVRVNATEVIRKKLLTSRGLNPDASFVQELQESFESLRAFKKDREAIRYTIEIACDVDSLVDSAPAFLKGLKKLRPESSEDERLKALTEFATALVDTRNFIVHAKPNYRQTGNECPAPQLRGFTALAKRAAQQAVRWFHGRHEHQRIV